MKRLENKYIIGSHLSVAGGVSKAFDRNEKLGAQALQIFVKNSNRREGKPLSEKERERFISLHSHSGIPVAVHTSYLINCASTGEKMEKSYQALKDEVERTAFLGLSDLVLHPGSHGGDGESTGVARITECLARLFNETDDSVRILLENTAGQGNSLGYDFAHLRDIMAPLPEERVGICFDTCHAFAAGYDFRTEEKYKNTMSSFQKITGLPAPHLIHLNDSKKELGSRVDRHAHIGEGFLGIDSFRNIFSDHSLKGIPMILETEKDDAHIYDRINMARIEAIIDGKDIPDFHEMEEQLRGEDE